MATVNGAVHVSGGDSQLASRIRSAVYVGSSPASTSQQRQEAYQECQKFKDSLVGNYPTLLNLISPQETPEVRLYALHLLEYLISHQWNVLPADSKVRMKALCMELMSQVNKSDPIYLLEGLSRCLIEVVKREWPQNWLTFLDELSGFCTMGRPELTDLVMRALRRLSEEVVELSTVTGQRKKDIQLALTESLATILPFLIREFIDSLRVYKDNSYADREMTLKVVKSILETLTAYVGWCEHSLVTCYDGQLIKSLCENLGDVTLSMTCADCLLVISSRHGNLAAASPVQHLFYSHSLEYISSATSVANSSLLTTKLGYDILKRLGQLTVSMGQQLIYIWGKEGNKVSVPDTMEQYLKLLLTFTGHESLLISTMCFEFWSTFIRACQRAKKAELITQLALQDLLNTCQVKLRKDHSPSDNSVGSQLNRIDFDDETDWLTAFYRNKSNIMSVIQNLRQLAEKELLDHCNRNIDSKLNEVLTHFSSGNQVCDPKSDLYKELESLNVFYHSACKDMTLTSDVMSLYTMDRVVAAVGLIQDPQLLSVLISFISALTPAIVAIDDELFKKIISTIFMMIQYSNVAYDKSLNIELNRHSSAIFIKFCTQYSSRLAPMFEELHVHIIESKERLDHRSYRLLLEGLLIISTEMKSYDKQLQYINLVFSNSMERWRQPALQSALGSCMALIEFIGLTQPDTPDRKYLDNQYMIQELLKDFLMVCRRVIPPTDPQDIQTGGFLDEAGQTRTAVFSFISPLLDDFFRCLSFHLQLYHPDIQQKFHPELLPEKVTELPMAERRLILGFQLPEDHRTLYTSKTSTEFLQKHILEAIDSILQMLVLICRSCSSELFRHESLIMKMLQSCSQCLHLTNPYIMKLIIRSVLKNLVTCCPPACKCQLFTELLHSFITPIADRLDAMWTTYRDKAKNRLTGLSDDDDDRTENEIIADELLRVCTREFLALVQAIVLEPKATQNSKPLSKESSAQSVDDTEMEEEMTDQTPVAALGPKPPVESTIAITKLEQDQLHYLSWLLSKMCGWMDTSTANKALDILPDIFQHLADAGRLTTDLCYHLLNQLLTALQVHGEHESVTTKLIGVIFSVYTDCRKLDAASTTQFMLQIPGVSHQSLMNFNVECGIIPPIGQKKKRPPPLKTKKLKFKKLLSSLISKNIGEQYKDKVSIRDLPPLVKKKTKYSDLMSASNVESSDYIGICALFDPNST